jgi:hypothetical protein
MSSKSSSIKTKLIKNYSAKQASTRSSSYFFASLGISKLMLANVQQQM